MNDPGMMVELGYLLLSRWNNSRSQQKNKTRKTAPNRSTPTTSLSFPSLLHKSQEYTFIFSAIYSRGNGSAASLLNSYGCVFSPTVIWWCSKINHRSRYVCVFKEIIQGLLLVQYSLSLKVMVIDLHTWRLRLYRGRLYRGIDVIPSPFPKIYSLHNMKREYYSLYPL